MTEFPYSYSFDKEIYKKIMSEQIDKRDDLKIIEVDNAYILPLIYKPNHLFGCGGVVDENMNYINESAILSRAGVISYPQKEERILESYVNHGYEFDCENVDYIDEEVVYLGFIQDHWGHFIVDFATRLWIVSQCENQDMKYAFFIKENQKLDLHPNIFRFLELMGINNENALFLNEITKFRKVIVPECSYQTNSYFSDSYLDTFDYVADKIQVSGKSYDKVYFSRLHYPKAKEKEIGEESIENLFKSNGYKVIYPEEHSLDEQIEIIRNAKEIAAVSGSLTHNMLFAQNGKKLTIINKAYIKNMVQRDINLIRKLDVTYVDAFEACMPVTMGFGPFLLSYTSHLSKYARDYDFNENAPSQYEKYQNMKRYLESYDTAVSNIYHGIPVKSDSDSVHKFNPEFTRLFTKNLIEYNQKEEPVSFKEKLKKILKGYIHNCRL